MKIGPEITFKSVTVQVIEHSIGVGNKGIDICTIRARIPRIIHSELLTHRVFSRNARSSRAVPTMTLAAEPIYIPEFLQNQPGMQGGLPLSENIMKCANEIWEQTASQCQLASLRLNAIGVHKQHANRMLEWFGYIDVLITSTYWQNFITLRKHSAAQPEIAHLAEAISKAKFESIPQILNFGQWHLPYILDEEREKFAITDLLAMSTARCARISYKPFNQDKINIDDDFRLFEKLTGKPVHASCLEHQATPDHWENGKWLNEEHHGNFFGWVQHRKLIDDEKALEWFEKTNLQYVTQEK